MKKITEYESVGNFLEDISIELDEFFKKNDTYAYIFIKDGELKIENTKPFKMYSYQYKTIKCETYKKGLTSSQWNMLGKILLNHKNSKVAI